MKIIDAHAHLYNEPDYAERLLEAMDGCNIEKTCISGLGQLYSFGTNDDVKNALKRHKDRFIGAVAVRPGCDSAEKIQWGFENGFTMVKVYLPKSGYEDPAYFGLWQKCVELKMPALFHTGIVTCKDVPGQGVSSWNMHPLRIEPITREFPDMKIIIAHLGVSSNMDAAELARLRPNVYVDLTGDPAGWRIRLDREGADKYLWWLGAFNKVIFGTDVHHSKIKQVLSDDIKRYEKLNIDKQTIHNIFYGNIAKILNLQ